MPTPIFFLDTCILGAFLDLKKPNRESKECANQLIAKLQGKKAYLVCPAIAKIELSKHSRVHHAKEAAGQRLCNLISEDFGKLTSAGIVVEPYFDISIAEQAKFRSLFEYTLKNYAEHEIHLSDAFIASEAALRNAIIVTFNEKDYNKAYKGYKVKWYNPLTKTMSEALRTDPLRKGI